MLKKESKFNMNENRVKKRKLRLSNSTKAHNYEEFIAIQKQKEIQRQYAKELKLSRAMCSLMKAQFTLPQSIFQSTKASTKFQTNLVKENGKQRNLLNNM